MIQAFESLGWRVRPFVVGDQSLARVAGAEKKTPIRGPLRPLLADLVRLGMGTINARRAWSELGGQVDWVYERFAVLQALGWIFRREGVPWILETNGLFFDEAKTERKSLVLTGLARRLENAAYHNCDVLVCVSEPLKKVIVTKTGVSPGKILVVPNGVNTAFFDPARYAPKRLFRGFTVGYVGSLVSWQGLDRLLLATRALNEEGLPIRVSIVGDGPARGEWEKLARELGLGEMVRFVGRVPLSEVPGYIAGFDVGFSGHKELEIGAMYHSPLKLYEYRSMGKPVVASAFADARRLLCSGRAGYLFDPHDPESLEKALEEAYHARYSFATESAAIREEIVRSHSWEARVRGMIPRIEKILEERA